MTAQIPDTPAQAKARAAFNEACQRLAAASVEFMRAKEAYMLASNEYTREYGAAHALGVA